MVVRPLERAVVAVAVMSAVAAWSEYSSSDRYVTKVVAMDDVGHTADDDTRPMVLCPAGFLPDFGSCVPFPQRPEHGDGSGAAANASDATEVQRFGE